ncbi:GAF domain-containing protein [Glaciihabitans sp. dw_435]|uniref:helix-turn-helix domain-containing protein n=1 Tax=Glaciihabitans sp. dw_435 TaxID=2720081 RepID=UPI001BD2763D|nr:GAF domain-containing protein [Glaciihabitans sp. dw_435]
MTRSWNAAPPVDARTIALAHDAIVGNHLSTTGVRRVVEESWNRALAHRLDPDVISPSFDLDDDALREYRSRHPLALVLPTIHRLLIRHTFDTGLIVAVGDQAGRLLWIDGDRALRRKAEGMLFVEGADWSEAAVGTSAPGTAIALDHGIQIHRAEHFTRAVHPWSCTAVPVHDPASGDILGVIDITGGDDAVAPATLPLVEATVAAVETELTLRRMDATLRSGPVAVGWLASTDPGPVLAVGDTAPTAGTHPAAAQSARAQPATEPFVLSVLGRDVAQLSDGVTTVSLSPRHAEILCLLCWHPEGLSAGRLAELIYGRADAIGTLRPEMVRLRKTLGSVDPLLVPTSRPYRLGHPPELDIHRALAFSQRGAHRVAIASYPGALLPASDAPGIVTLRADIHARVRDALLVDATADSLLEFAATTEGGYDLDVMRAALTRLPPGSSRRAPLIDRIARIDAELARN